jgi:hypothetical protein
MWARGVRVQGREAAAMSTRLGPIQCRERLGGVLKFYYRDAA